MSEGNVSSAERRAQSAERRAQSAERGSHAHEPGKNASDSGGNDGGDGSIRDFAQRAFRELGREFDQRIGQLSDEIDRRGGARDAEASAIVNVFDTRLTQMRERVEEPGWQESDAPAAEPDDDA